MCGVLHFGGNNFCVQRLTCRAISAASAERLVKLYHSAFEISIMQLTPMDRATPPPPIADRALFTKLDAECDQQVTVVVDS